MKKYFLYKIFFVALVVISARGSAQQPVKVTLRVNYSNAVKLFHDEPVVLSVAISNQEDQESQRWNKAADRRLDQLEVLLKENKISREDYNKQKEKLKGGKRAISSLTLGTAANPWLQLVKWKMINAGTGAEIILSAKPLMNPSSPVNHCRLTKRRPPSLAITSNHQINGILFFSERRVLRIASYTNPKDSSGSTSLSRVKSCADRNGFPISGPSSFA